MSAASGAPRGGSRSGFFDHFPLYYETGNTPRGARLNARHECLIRRNLACIENRTVLDVGSHDGRWTFAAIRAGATHVVGIEPRVSLVDAAVANLRHYGIPREKYSFYVGDALETLVREEIRVDTVFLFGIFYHVNYHVALVEELWKTGATTVIIDVTLAPDSEDRNSVTFKAERTDSISAAAHEIFPGAGFAIVGQPSRQAVEFLFEAFGFTVSEVPWRSYLARWGTDGLGDYAAGSRRTFVAVRPAAAA